VSARATGTGLRAAALAVLLLGAAGALAGCGHYGPPVRAEQYRQQEEARRAEERRLRVERAKAAQAPAEAPAPAPSPPGAPEAP
jgi:dihydrodipicolinate synthase/N-acetylneuraminate lyase